MKTLYDVLGVASNAKMVDIGRAYNNLVAEFRQENTAPDPRRETQIEEAYKTLSDPIMRDAYDASLRERPAKPKSKAAMAGAGVAVVVAAGAIFFAMRPAPVVVVPPREAKDILAELSRSVGRLQGFDVSGQARPLGMAFALEEGVMGASCRNMPQGAQLTVTIAPRTVPARIAMADDASGLCTLAVDRAASWPLSRGSLPRVGDKVYAVYSGAAGETLILESSVKRVHTDAQGRVIEIANPIAASNGGAPLLDGQGRVVGVAMLAEGALRHVALPSSWMNAAAPPPRRSEPEPAPAAAAAAPADAAATGKVGEVDSAQLLKKREELFKSGAAREDLGKKLRPPPNVPDDL